MGFLVRVTKWLIPVIPCASSAASEPKGSAAPLSEMRSTSNSLLDARQCRRWCALSSNLRLAPPLSALLLYEVLLLILRLPANGRHCHHVVVVVPRCWLTVCLCAAAVAKMAAAAVVAKVAVGVKQFMGAVVVCVAPQRAHKAATSEGKVKRWGATNDERSASQRQPNHSSSLGWWATRRCFRSPNPFGFEDLRVM